MVERRGGTFLNRAVMAVYAAAGLMLMVGGVLVAWLPRWWAYGAGCTIGVLGGMCWGMAWIVWDNLTDRAAAVHVIEDKPVVLTAVR